MRKFLLVVRALHKPLIALATALAVYYGLISGDEALVINQTLGSQ